MNDQLNESEFFALVDELPLPSEELGKRGFDQAIANDLNLKDIERAKASCKNPRSFQVMTWCAFAASVLIAAWILSSLDFSSENDVQAGGNQVVKDEIVDRISPAGISDFKEPVKDFRQAVEGRARKLNDLLLETSSILDPKQQADVILRIDKVIDFLENASGGK